MKKTLKIIAFVLGLVLLGLLYYFFFFAKNSTNPANNPITSITNLFPFGHGGTSTTTPGTTGAGTPENTLPTQTGSYLQKLRLISNEPVAGSTFVDTTSGTLIRYMEKATGHIYDVSTYSALTIETSNTTIPKIHEAFFTEGGLGIIARYIGDDNETIQTIYGKISSTTAITTLPDNIRFVSVAPSGKNIFYLMGDNNGSTGILATPNTSTKKQIWVSPITHFIPQFINDNQVLLTTSPNASAPGSVYIVNTKTAASKSVLAQVADLSVIANPAGTLLLAYSSANNGQLFTYSLAKGTTTQVTPVTFPEKCVFDPNTKNIMYCAVPKDSLNSSSLDNWYLGLTSFADDIWKYDISNNTTTFMEDLSANAGRDIDAINLHINSAGSLITFESKTDGSLWSLNVTQ